MECNMYGDGLIEEFITEAGEHLASMESDLMILEGVEGGHDENLINNIFRSAHTIKGTAGMLGFDKISSLSHKMENLLHLAREGSLTLEPPAFQALFTSLDLLSAMIAAPQESDSIDIDAALETLAQILPSQSREQAVKQVVIETPGRPSIFSVDELTIELASRGGKYIYLVEFDLIHDIHGKGKTPIDLLNELECSGTILNCMVGLEAAGDLESGFSNSIPLYILYSSVAEPALAPALFEVDKDRVIHIDRPTVAVAQGDDKPESEVRQSSARWTEDIEGVNVSAVGGQGTLVLPRNLTIMKADALKRAFLRVLEDCDTVQVDGSSVQEVDLTGFQVLLSACKTFETQGKEIALQTPFPSEIAFRARQIGFAEDSCGTKAPFFV